MLQYNSTVDPRKLPIALVDDPLVAEGFDGMRKTAHTAECNFAFWLKSRGWHGSVPYDFKGMATNAILRSSKETRPPMMASGFVRRQVHIKLLLEATPFREDGWSAPTPHNSKHFLPPLGTLLPERPSARVEASVRGLLSWSSFLLGVVAGW